LLVVITGRKALRLLRDQGRVKRGGNAHGDRAEWDGFHEAVEQIVGNEPTPEFAIQLTEQYEYLLGLLNDDQRAIAVAKLDGLSNPQIAKLLNRPLRTVERKLQLIRTIWERVA
jgi:DNA-directed RNA polymerase specialized sigma24 family protein